MICKRERCTDDKGTYVRRKRRCRHERIKNELLRKKLSTERKQQGNTSRKRNKEQKKIGAGKSPAPILK